ncbi:MAG: MFS transporter [Clostridia bacterium]|nr:MFS transporter [Clostridia bacterium]
MTSRRMNWVFGFLQGTYWMSYGVLFPFLVRMCASFGYDDFECGVILTGVTVANLLMQPLIGSVCDRLLRIKPLFIGMFLTGAAASFLIYVGKKSFVVLVLTFLLLSACIQTLQYIIDIWSVRISSTGIRYNYGFSRSFGSLFYAVATGILGFVLDRFGMDVIEPIFFVSALLTAFVALWVDENECAARLAAEREAGGRKRGAVPFFRAIGMLVRNPRYMIFLVSYFIIQIGNLPIYNYTARKIEILGGGSSLLGIALFFQAISEVPMLLLQNRLKARFSAETLMRMALIGMVIRAAGIAFAPTAELVAASYLLQFVSFGIFIGALVLYVPEIVEKEILFTAQTVFAAVTIGLAGILGNLAGGYVSKTCGVMEMMHAFVGFVAAGCLMFLICTLARQHKMRKERERV